MLRSPRLVPWKLGLKGMLLGSEGSERGFGLARVTPREGTPLLSTVLGKLRPGDCVELGSELKSEGWAPQRNVGMGSMESSRSGQ